MKVYQKLLAQYVASGGLSLELSIELAPPGGLSQHQLEEFRQQLQALGLSTTFETET